MRTDAGRLRAPIRFHALAMTQRRFFERRGAGSFYPPDLPGDPDMNDVQT